MGVVNSIFSLLESGFAQGIFERRMKYISIFFAILIAGTILSSCAIRVSVIHFSGLFKDEGQSWSYDVWMGLKTEIADEKGEVFKVLKDDIKKKMNEPVIFAGDIDGFSTEESFLLSPRNTMVRPSNWDKTFYWQRAERGRDYVLHIYAGGKELLELPQGNDSKLTISCQFLEFEPSVEYNWDITLCVDLCGLHLSSNVFDRPSFELLTPEEEWEVSLWLGEVSRNFSSNRLIPWLDGGGGEWNDNRFYLETEDEIALKGLVLEHFGLFMEEEALLAAGIERYPESTVLNLMISGAYDLMGSPGKAREHYLRAQEFYHKNREMSRGNGWIWF